MEGSLRHLRLLSAGHHSPATEPVGDSPIAAVGPSNSVILANQELIRPPTYRRGHRDLEPGSAAWFDELQQKRYTRHGAWLSAALEFGRHPGESVLLLNPGVGSDAVSYLQQGTDVTLAVGPNDQPGLLHDNLARHGYEARLASVSDGTLPFPDGAFDVAVWNGLHHPAPDCTNLTDELYRVLKAGGKLIGLFPAYYDAGFWQDLVVPLQRLYWRRPPDPTSTPKTTRKELRRQFGRFVEHRVSKRHLRRSELPHLWRALPLLILERMIGRVLILKAFKPLTASRSAASPLVVSRSVAA